jgi:hypothetical protein
MAPNLIGVIPVSPTITRTGTFSRFYATASRHCSRGLSDGVGNECDPHRRLGLIPTEAIVTAASELLSEQGPSAVTMRRVDVRLGVGAGTPCGYSATMTRCST